MTGFATLPAVIAKAAAAARPATVMQSAAVAVKAPQSAGDIFRRAQAQVTESRALGFNLNLAAAIAAITSEI